MVFGPAGMILGGMSGIGTTTNVKTTPYLIIAYTGEDENDIKNLVFWAERDSFVPICKLFVAEYNAKRAPKPSLIQQDSKGDYLL